MGQTFGNEAVAAAQRFGVQPATLAAFGAAESDFRNVAASNGSTSALGIWQLTSGTWQEAVTRYNLPYTDADKSNPAAQAVVASAVIRAYSGATAQALGRPATVQEAYGSFVFGPSVGSQLATASADTPLNTIISDKSLSNNGMTGWNVGHWREFSNRRLGTAAGQSALTTGT